MQSLHTDDQKGANDRHGQNVIKLTGNVKSQKLDCEICLKR